ncbi:hypothetical protein ARMGADRAFT_1089551 [Armillaria gallica]|uniref:Uncharacterized protein n=1 Tax=Armillaria gallica TaxID=47427 RepID=A0A2H3CXK0_ARMGA|nr:hypothetical protein ARMGADRAFT_1089551 [Armillaria gallica]
MPFLEIVNGRQRWVGGHPNTYYNDRMELDDDYEVIYSHETAISATGHVYEDPVFSETVTWELGDSWNPMDNHKMALDPTGEWFEEEILVDICDSRVWQQSGRIKRNKQPHKKSKLAMSCGYIWSI